MKTPMVQNILLIWLDTDIDAFDDDCHNTITQLRRVVNSIEMFTDEEECIKFLEDINNEKACMIISGSLGQIVVPKVHHMFQVNSVFIFCNNKLYHEKWAKKWSKIKGVFTEIEPICEALKQVAQQCEQNAMPMSFMPLNNSAKKHLDQLDPPFMYIQIMKEILLGIKFDDEHFKNYIDYCREVFAENKDELKIVKKFERKYRNETPIWWYTLECFLYSMLNRALRTMDVDIIIRMGFFIKDLHYHIEQLHKEQCNSSHARKKFTVYRGQDVSKTDFEHLIKSKGGLISFNNFLSTSKDRTTSLDFADRYVTNPDLIGILFVMTIDPCQSTTPFASVKHVSSTQGEDEVLFAMQTVFRIDSIAPVGLNSRFFQVELTLTEDNDKYLRQLTDYIRQETYPDAEGWYRLGLVLHKMGQYGKAEEIYQNLLQQTKNESKQAHIYIQLGLAKYNQEEYRETITYYRKAVEIYRKNLPSNNFNLASAYNNIGLVYYDIGEYSTALSYYRNALEISEGSLSPNHPDLAAAYNNIGLVYYKMSEYSQALWYYEKDFEIIQKSLPSNHPNLGASNDNLGLLYERIGNYSKAHSFYECAVHIGQQSLPADHRDLKKWTNNLERIKTKLL